jgi:hypothetical protein
MPDAFQPYDEPTVVAPVAPQPVRFNADDRIEYAVVKDDRNKERRELHFRNLTKSEAVQLLMTLDKLQTDRKITALIGDTTGEAELALISQPEDAAARYANAQHIDPEIVEAYVQEHQSDPLRDNPIVGGMSEEQAESILKEMRDEEAGR